MTKLSFIGLRLKNQKEMDGNKNVAVLIDVYSQYGGASKAAVGYARTMKEYGYNSFILCNNTLPGECYPEDVHEINSVSKCRHFITQNNISVIHYFKATKSLCKTSLFAKMVRAIAGTHKDINVLMTVCQQPSYARAILTPTEIQNCDHIIFIDKTAYKDPMFHFIPDERKTWMHLLPEKESSKNTNNDSYAKQSYGLNNNTIVFGRGSTLNKCPKDVIELYDRIKTSSNKRFIIVGVPEENNWLRKKVKKRGEDDISLYPLLLSNEYLSLISSFDIFLYYLPTKSYSSIDGSLTKAMSLGLPVVVYGPPAPKEVVIHGVNGFVAETKDDFVKYAEMLANNSVLREQMGRNARKLFYENAPDVFWKEAHIRLMEEVIEKGKLESIKCPFIDIVKINVIGRTAWLLSVIVKGCELLEHTIIRQ